MLYYIYHGSLPWASACAIKTPGRHQRVAKLKEQALPELLDR